MIWLKRAIYAVAALAMVVLAFHASAHRFDDNDYDFVCAVAILLAIHYTKLALARIA